jgi:ribosomal subunit interface protein
MIHQRNSSFLTKQELASRVGTLKIEPTADRKMALALIVSLASSSSAYSLQMHSVNRPAVLRSTALSMTVPLQVTGKDVTDPMRGHAEKKLSVPLEKFKAILNDGKVVELHMRTEKLAVHDEAHAGRSMHHAEVIAHLKGDHKCITVSAEGEDMYATIDDLEAKLASKLRKAKEKTQAVKEARNRGSKEEMDAAVLSDDDNEPAPKMGPL